MASKRRGLGRGLEALLGDSGGANEQQSVVDLPIEKIQPGRYQPRTQINQDKLAELAASIKAQGLVQPVVVRPIAGDRYELIAGERRWRAAQLASLRVIPAIVREVPDQAVVAMALIENIQREDLSALEEALALKRLIEEFDLTHQAAADAVGRSRAAVSNLLRLLELEPAVRNLVEHKRLEMGHARALLAMHGSAQVMLAEEAAVKEWSVRETEAAVRRALAAPKVAAPKQADPDVNQLERELSERLAASVAIKHKRGGKGQLVIRYASLDELDGILARIK
ncbi:MAG: ParB/RepB/Spo0J family partition protein [Xanthomonadales bacterium]|nr:ParB/RepB/Spo0J family partition protein [Xanthomonadales bacterium]